MSTWGTKENKKIKSEMKGVTLYQVAKALFAKCAGVLLAVSDEVLNKYIEDMEDNVRSKHGQVYKNVKVY